MSQAPEPEDVIWQALEKQKTFIHRLLVAGFVIGLILACSAVTLYFISVWVSHFGSD